MKTAIQELIDYLLKWDKEGDENFDALLCGTLVKATLALEKEKEQILEAVAKGRKQKVENGMWGYTYTPEEIYNQDN